MSDPDPLTDLLRLHAAAQETSLYPLHFSLTWTPEEEWRAALTSVEPAHPPESPKVHALGYGMSSHNAALAALEDITSRVPNADS